MAFIAVMALSVACAASDPVSVTPEATMPEKIELPSPTPARTPTPVPTTRPNAPVPRGPTPTPVDYVPPTLPAGDEYRFVDVLGLAPSEWQLLGYGAVKLAPLALEQTAQPLDNDTVIQLWAEFLGDTRVIVDGSPTHQEGQIRELGDFDLLFCRAGYGVVMAVPPSMGRGVGSVFDWDIQHSIASPWWLPTLAIRPRDAAFRPVYPRSPLVGPAPEIYRRPVLLVGEQVWVDQFLNTELKVTVIDIANPDQFCSDTVPDGVRLFTQESTE